MRVKQHLSVLPRIPRSQLQFNSRLCRSWKLQRKRSLYAGETRRPSHLQVTSYQYAIKYIKLPYVTSPNLYLNSGYVTSSLTCFVLFSLLLFPPPRVLSCRLVSSPLLSSSSFSFSTPLPSPLLSFHLISLVISKTLHSNFRCYAGFSGVNCSLALCLSVNNCSGNGQCLEADLCDCDVGYTGADCANASCESVNYCSGETVWQTF